MSHLHGPKHSEALFCNNISGGGRGVTRARAQQREERTSLVESSTYIIIPSSIINKLILVYLLRFPSQFEPAESAVRSMQLRSDGIPGGQKGRLGQKLHRARDTSAGSR